ncbi:MAG: hypothetical protein Salg2KO_18650 [Salibacteraceae bacterium]
MKSLKNWTSYSWFGVVFMVLITCIFIVGYTAKSRFDQILTTLLDEQHKQNPVENVAHIQTLLADVEYSVKVFVLTNSDSVLHNFYEQTFALISEFEYLEDNTSNYSADVNAAIDTLEDVTFSRVKIFEELVDAKDEFRVNKAMNKVEDALMSATEEMEEAYANNKTEEGKRLALRKLFTREKQKAVFDEREKRIPDSIVQRFSEDLTRLSRAERERESLLREENLRIERDGAIVRAQVDSIASIIKNLQLKQKLKNEAEVTELAKSSRESVVLIVVLSIGLILALGLLVFFQVRSIHKYIQASNEASKRALQLAESKETFIANVSHELRTPLNSIIGFTELIEKETDLKKRMEFNRMVNESGKHLKELINDLLDLSKLDLGKFPIKSNPFNPKSILDETREMVYSQFQNDKVKFELDFHLTSPLLLGDRTRLKQVLTNVLSNAFKFTPTGKVSLSMVEEKSAEKSMLHLTISDTGIGIPKKALTQIFDAFNQVSGNLTTENSGTGLGLSITHKIVNQLGGTIDVASEVGVGTTFKISIPFEHCDQWKFYEGKRECHNLSGFKILIADDSAFNLSLLENILSNSGAQVVSADSGIKALEKLEQESFDLCVFDIKMPHMDGIELAKKVRAQLRKNAPALIALTAAATDTVEKECKNVGYLAIESKPIDSERLTSLIHQMCTSETIDSEDDKLDISYVNNIFENDPEFRNDMLSTFVKIMDESVEQLQSIKEDSDLKFVAGIHHKVIPALEQLHLYNLTSLLTKIKEESSDSRNLKNIHVLVNDFTKSYHQVRMQVFKLTETV